MKLRKSIIAIAAAALTLSVSAQQSTHDNYVGVSFGGGLNTMLYKTANGQQSLGGGLDAGLFYGRFFNKTVGLGVGLQYTWANSTALYNYNEVTTGLIHPSNPNQLYNLTTSFNDWRERQTMGVLSIPVEVLFRKELSARGAFIAGIGLSVDFPIHGNYTPKGGTYSTTGTFPSLGDYVVSDLPEHGFSTYENFRDGKITNRAKVGASVLADLGFRVALNDNWGLYMGLYAGYGFTNLLAEAKTAPLVIINDDQQIDYAGTFGSNETAKANLLRCGLKLAIDFGWPRKDNTVAEAEPLPEPAPAPVVDEEAERKAALDKAKSDFEAYKQQQRNVAGSMAKADDSDASKALIAKAQRDIAALQFDENLSEAENRARVDAIIAKLRKDLADQREKDRLAREAAQKAEQEKAKRLRIEAINVYFENGGEEPAISDEDKALISELCEMMKADPTIKVVVIGHTDSYGDPEQNLNYYGVRRAEVLRDYMVGKGVPANQIRCESRGQNEPVAPNDTRANRALNRRANIRFE